MSDQPNDKPKKLTPDERIDAICEILSEKHGFSFPVEVFDPSTEDEDTKAAVKKK